MGELIRIPHLDKLHDELEAVIATDTTDPKVLRQQIETLAHALSDTMVWCDDIYKIVKALTIQSVGKD